MECYGAVAVRRGQKSEEGCVMLMTGKCVCVRFVSIILLMVVLCAVPVAEPAEASESQVIRVGFFQFDGYHIIDETGRPSGYGYDLLQHMAGYTDWNYEYVGYENSWSEMQEMLENGEIDLLTSAQKTEERMERFDFSEESIGTSAAILTVKAGNEQYLSGDYQNWSGMRIGLLFGNSRNHGLEAYAKEQGFTYEPVYFDDTQEMINALKTGNQIDAVLTSNLRSIKDEWVLAQFDSAPFFYYGEKRKHKAAGGSKSCAKSCIQR